MRQLALVTALLIATTARATIIPVADGQSIQAAIDGAQDGDTISVATGTFEGDLDFKGKAVTVRGAGPDTIIRGSGTNSVVRFVSDEGPASVLDSVIVTNGSAERGGAIFVFAASPTIIRTTLLRNRAVSAGSAMYLERSTARLYNNLIAYNTTKGTIDTHAVHIANASPTIVNNTVTHGDSNGIFVYGPVALPTIMNNILAYNGSQPPGKAPRGRGICDLGPATVIQWNLFFHNRKAAILTAGNIDYQRVRRAELAINSPRFADNIDAPPRFVAPHRLNFGLRARSAAVHGGAPDETFFNVDGSRNTMGYLGGPYAAPSTSLP